MAVMENSVGNITPNNHIRSADPIEPMGIGKKIFQLRVGVLVGYDYFCVCEKCKFVAWSKL